MSGDKTPFEEWWHNTGSGLRFIEGEEVSEFAREITLIAWVDALAWYRAYLEKAISKKLSEAINEL